MAYVPANRPRTPAPRRVASVFARLLRIARKASPGLRVVLREGDARAFPETRNYAYCSSGREGLTIVVAPRMALAALDRIEGVLMHEIAHAVFFAGGEEKHAEREADRLAERLFGCTLRYDVQDAVQTTAAGTRPRPAYLPV